jgi:hypothetical protein
MADYQTSHEVFLCKCFEMWQLGEAGFQPKRQGGPRAFTAERIRDRTGDRGD